MIASATIAHIGDQFRLQQNLDFRFIIDFGGCRISVECNDPDLCKSLQEYLRPFITDNDNFEMKVTAIETEAPELDLKYTIKQPDPGKTKIKEEYIDLPDGRIVRKRLTGMVFLFGGEINLAIGPCISNVNQVVNFINNRFIQWLLNRDCLLCHAAAVSDGSQGMAIAGFSGMGKSTLALHLMRHDLRFVSNDRLMIRMENDRLMMYGVGKHPRVNPGTILNNKTLSPVIPENNRKRLINLSTSDLWKFEQKYDVIIEDVYGPDRFDLYSPLNTFVILNWKLGDGPTDIHQVDLNIRRDLLGAIIKSPGLFYEPDGNPEDFDFSEKAYLKMLKNCQIIEMTGGVDFDSATEKCIDLFKSEK